MKRGVLSVITIICSATLYAQVCEGESFTDGAASLTWPVPVRENRPGCYWWWPGSAVDKQNLTWNLETMRKAGIGGGVIVPIYGVKGAEDRFIQYLSPKWLEMLDHAVREAERLGMWLDMTTGTGWPFGGPEVTTSDADARVIYEDGKLSQRFSGRKVKRAAPGGEGFSINPYSKRAMENYLKKFDRAFSESDIKLPRAQYHDSFEYSGNWCDDFLEEFESRRGYDLSEHLPELFGRGDPDTVARIKSDYRETLSELHLRYIETWVAWAGKHGCTTRDQAHGAPANVLDVYAASGIPETEIFGAKVFKIPGLRRDPENVRENEHFPLFNCMASSAAHVAGKKLVASETCTWVRNHFRAALSQVKPEIDQLFLAGINHIFYHGCCYSPRDATWPGWLFYASLEANPRNSIWRDIPALNAYITRCQSILQSGKPANDILLYWPVYDIWHNRQGLQQMLTVHRHEWLSQTTCGKTGQWFVDRGYAFDFISDRQLEQTHCEDGNLVVPSGLSYRTVLVPKTNHMPLKTFRKLIGLASSGATILFNDQLPEDVPGFGGLANRRRQFKGLLNGLKLKPIGNGEVEKAKVGKGRFLLGTNLKVLLRRAFVPREEMVDVGLGFVRRTHEAGYHYFITNLTDQAADGWFALGHDCQSAVILEPLSGRTGTAEVREGKNKTEIYLQLLPGETRIIRTFTSRTVKGDTWPAWRPAADSVDISGQWQIDFIEGGPRLPASFKTTGLKSWTILGDEEARRFAGAARYRIEFELPDYQADEWILVLGDVRESARVKINGRDAGTLFGIPFKMYVGTYLKKGRNLLEIEVTNLAANRIRDLDVRGVKWKKFYDINFVNHNYKKFDASKWPLIKSGLLGPVRLIPMKRKSL